MPKISAMMDIGKRSMANSQATLHTVGHNIANKSTEGYSRQRVEIQSNEPTGSGSLRMGSGAKVVKVARINNPQLERQIGKEQTAKGYLEGMASGMNRVEQVVNEQLVDGLNTSISQFFNAFRELSNNPENTATRTLVAESAAFMARDFNRVHQNFTGIQDDLDRQVDIHVKEINEITKEIASLNEKIQLVEITGASANDERDRRDLLLKKLGEKINIRWGEGRDGMVTITAGHSAVLVAGHESRQLAVSATAASPEKREGNFDVLYLGDNPKAPITITSQIKSGQLGGLLEVRDKTINDLLGRLNEIAGTITEKVNDAHVQGFNAYDRTQELFFEPVQKHLDAALYMNVNRGILEDPGRIAVAGQPQAPGDNRIANRIAQLQYDKILEDGVTSVDEFYNSMVGQVGVITQRTNRELETQDHIVGQLMNLRESISGVSLDEETAKMIEFQKAFDASARLIRTADEMLETVINLKRY